VSLHTSDSVGKDQIAGLGPFAIIRSRSLPISAVGTGNLRPSAPTIPSMWNAGDVRKAMTTLENQIAEVGQIQSHTGGKLNSSSTVEPPRFSK
jgi:hypothetical protein